MKPRINLAQRALPDGSSLILQEHDGRVSLLIQDQQICGPATKATEEELARLASAPFRPARQPKLWFAGLGLGHSLAAAATELRQKRATFIVSEPIPELVEWHRRLLPSRTLLDDPRVMLVSDPGPSGLTSFAGQLHAIIVHLDASPTGHGNRPLTDDPRWLAAAYEALQPGGLLAIAGSRPVASLTRRLHRAGFQVAESNISAVPDARKPRFSPVWLARKGKGAD